MSNSHTPAIRRAAIRAIAAALRHDVYFVVELWEQEYSHNSLQNILIFTNEESAVAAILRRSKQRPFEPIRFCRRQYYIELDPHNSYALYSKTDKLDLASRLLRC